jgi:hypothetical protein
VNRAYEDAMGPYVVHVTWDYETDECLCGYIYDMNGKDGRGTYQAVHNPPDHTWQICTKCLDHPDYPMLVLANAGEPYSAPPSDPADSYRTLKASQYHFTSPASTTTGRLSSTTPNTGNTPK